MVIKARIESATVIAIGVAAVDKVARIEEAIAAIRRELKGCSISRKVATMLVTIAKVRATINYYYFLIIINMLSSQSSYFTPCHCCQIRA